MRQFTIWFLSGLNTYFVFVLKCLRLRWKAHVLIFLYIEMLTSELRHGSIWNDFKKKNFTYCSKRTPYNLHQTQRHTWRGPVKCLKKGGVCHFNSHFMFYFNFFVRIFTFVLIVEMQGFIQMSHFLEAVVSKNSKLANENVQNN